MKRPTRNPSAQNPYISDSSETKWPEGLPRPRPLFPRTQQAPPNKHLELVCSGERTGIISDIIFDLRHPKLDPIEWTAESLLRTGDDRIRRAGRPFLWFPWYGEYELELKNIKASAEKKRRQLSKAENVALTEALLPEQIVCRGDTLSLKQNDPQSLPASGMQDIVQGEAVRLAYLTITRLNGDLIDIQTPVRFFARHISIRMNTVDVALDKIRTMIGDAENSQEIKRIAEKAEVVGSMINSLMYTQEVSDDQASELRHIASLSLLLGQLWTKAETATTVQPLAELARRSQLKAKESGVKSGMVRSNAPWRQIAEEEALRQRELNPSYSQDDLASEISYYWKSETIKVPSHETLKKLISKLEHSGQLQPRKTRT
jgi:hypothetical protein